MSATSKVPAIAVATLALTAIALVATTDAFARGPHGGGHGGGHRHHLAGAGPRTGHHHGHHLHHHRHQRGLFTRFTPCVVWTRQGWTAVCGNAAR